MNFVSMNLYCSLYFLCRSELMSISVELSLLFWSAVVSIRKGPTFFSHLVSMKGPSDSFRKRKYNFLNHVLHLGCYPGGT